MNKIILEKIFSILQTFDIPYILIGGYASAIWGAVRATKDVDFLIDIPFQKTRQVVEEFKRCGFKVTYRSGDIGDPVMGVIQLLFSIDDDEESIELLLGIRKMPDKIYLRAEKVNFEEVEIPVVSPEDLIVLKLLAGGPVDLQDARNLARIMGEKLDANYLKNELERLKLSFGNVF